MANPIAAEAVQARERAEELDAQALVLDLFQEYLESFTDVVVLVTRRYPEQPQRRYQHACLRYNGGSKSRPVWWWSVTGQSTTRGGPMDDAGFVKFVTSEHTISAWITTDMERIDALE